MKDLSSKKIKGELLLPKDPKIVCVTDEQHGQTDIVPYKDVLWRICKLKLTNLDKPGLRTTLSKFEQLWAAHGNLTNFLTIPSLSLFFKACLLDISCPHIKIIGSAW